MRSLNKILKTDNIYSGRFDLPAKHGVGLGGKPRSHRNADPTGRAANRPECVYLYTEIRA